MSAKVPMPPVSLDDIASAANLSSQQVNFLRFVHAHFRTTGKFLQEGEAHKQLTRKRKRDVYEAGILSPDWLLARNQRDQGDLVLTLTAVRLVEPDAAELADVWAIVGNAIHQYNTDGAPDWLESSDVGVAGDRLDRAKWFLSRGYLWFLRPADQPGGSIKWTIEKDIGPYLDATSLDDVIGIVEAHRRRDASWRATLATPDEVGAAALDAATSQLLASPIPSSADPVVVGRLRQAQERFFALGATDDDRKEAIRHLAAALEHIRDPLRLSLLSKPDDAMLFEIANKFAIRHENPDQRRDYSSEWLSWIFHVFWATVKLGLEVVDRATRDDAVSSQPTE